MVQLVSITREFRGIKFLFLIHFYFFICLCARVCLCARGYLCVFICMCACGYLCVRMHVYCVCSYLCVNVCVCLCVSLSYLKDSIIQCCPINADIKTKAVLNQEINLIASIRIKTRKQGKTGCPEDLEVRQAAASSVTERRTDQEFGYVRERKGAN